MLSAAAGLFIKEICKPYQHLALTNFSHDITFTNGQISMIVKDHNIAAYYYKNQIPTLCTDESGRTLAEGIYLNKTLENTHKECAFLMPLLKKIGQRYKQNYGKNSIHLLTREASCQHLYSLFFDLSETDFLHWIINNGNFLTDFIENYTIQAHDLILEAEAIENRIVLPTTNQWTPLNNRFNTNNQNTPITILHNELQIPIHIPKQQGRCLLLMAQGQSAKEIANKLQISYRTVEYYFEKTRKQLGCISNKKLIASYADQLNLINSQDPNL